MNRFYVLKNSLDSTLYFKSNSCDTRSVFESKRFLTRRSAEKYSRVRGLNEKYQVKLVRSVNESVRSKDSSIDEIRGALDDIKDMIDTTIDLAEYYNDSKLSEDTAEYNEISLDDILEKLRKMKSYMAGIAFSPTFDNSLGHASITNNEPNISSDTTSNNSSK